MQHSELEKAAKDRGIWVLDAPLPQSDCVFKQIK